MTALNTALEFASRGYAVLPVGPNKRPWTPNGVYSASTDPSIFSRWDWSGAACAVATGEKVEVLDVDVRGGVGGLPYGAQGNPSACDGGIDGFATLKALGLDWERIEALTQCARTPSGGVHALWKPVSGRSRTLGPGAEWFSTGKYVVVPPAPGRVWLNDLPIAEAPEELKQIVLASHTLKDAGRISSAHLMCNAEGPLPQLPKYLYFKLLHAMPSARPRCQRCAVTILNKLRLMPQGRNTGLYTSALGFKELIGRGSVSPAGACVLLVEASKANGYLAKDGEETVRLTIMSGLGLKEWPAEGTAQSIHCARKASVTYGTATHRRRPEAIDPTTARRSRGQAFDSGKALSN